MGWQDRAYNRDDTGGIPPIRFALPQTTRLTMVLIVVNLGIFLLMLLPRIDAFFSQWMSLTMIGGAAWIQPWRWVSYQYVHGGPFHLLFNMLGLFFFMPSLELRWGWQRALAFYTAGGIAAGVLYALMSIGPFPSFLIGASGSVLALLGAVALFYPERQLILLFFPVPIRVAAALFGALYLLTSFGGNLSDAAHLGGLAFGWFAPLIYVKYLTGLRQRFADANLRRQRQAEVDEQQEIDRILEKVSRQGMHSLSGREKRTLARASQRQQHLDSATRRPSAARGWR